MPRYWSKEEEEEENEADVAFADKRFVKRMVAGIAFLILFTSSIVLVLVVGYLVGLNVKRSIILPPQENPNCPIQKAPRSREEILAGKNIAADLGAPHDLVDGDRKTCVTRNPGKKSFGHVFRETFGKTVPVVYYMIRIYPNPEFSFYNVSARTSNYRVENSTFFNSHLYANYMCGDVLQGNIDPTRGPYEFMCHNYTVAVGGVRIELMTHPDNCKEKTCTGEVSLCEMEIYGYVLEGGLD